MHTKCSIVINLPFWGGAVWKYEPASYQTLDDFMQSTDKYEYFKSELHCFYMYFSTCFPTILATVVLTAIFAVAGIQTELTICFLTRKSESLKIAALFTPVLFFVWEDEYSCYTDQCTVEMASEICEYPHVKGLVCSY